MDTGTPHAVRYAPSWFNRFLNFCGNLPIPAWSAYVILLFLQGLPAHIAAWQAGLLTPWEFNLPLAFCGIWNIESLLFSHYLDVIARDALMEYRPMLENLSEEEFGQIRYEFTIMPARSVLWISILGFALGLFFGHTARPYLPIMFGWPSFVYPLWGFSWCVLSIFCYRVFRQLKLVSRLYRSTQKIDLYYLKPLYSLSRLALWTSLSVVIIMVLNTILFVPQLLASSTFIVVDALAFLVALGIFLMPLYGIKNRIVDQKNQLLAMTARELEAGYGLLSGAISVGDSKKLGDVKAILDMVHRKRDFLHSIPVWPWNPGTFTALITAILLPVMLGILSRVFQRILGL